LNGARAVLQKFRDDQIISESSQEVAVYILRPLAEDAVLMTERSDEGEPSWSEWSDDSASPLLCDLRRGKTQADVSFGLRILGSQQVSESHTIFRCL
jgi:hypothetical protein